MKTINLLFKSFAAISMALTFSAGAGFAVGCNPDNNENEELNPSEKPEPDDNPQPEEPVVTLEDVVKEYNGVVTNVKNANSLTIDSDVIGKVGVMKLDGGKVGLTTADGTNYYETAEDKTFKYSLQNDGYHKALSDDEITAESVKTSVSTYLDKITWKSFNDEKVLSGEIILGETALSKATITASYDTKANTLTFTSTNQTVKIYDTNKTLVTLPQVTVDETQQKPPVEEFKITAENIEEVKQAMLPHIENLCVRATQKSTLQEVFSVYLTKSEGSNVIDTIGAIYTCTRPSVGNYFKWVEMTIPTQEDITYEKILRNELNYELSSTSCDQKFSFSVGNESQYENMVETLKSQTFGKDYEQADWTGWYGTNNPGASDHTLVMVKDKKIYVYGLLINNNKTTLSIEQSVEQNFKEKQESEDTWHYVTKEVTEITTESKLFLQIEKEETEQNI